MQRLWAHIILIGSLALAAVTPAHAAPVDDTTILHLLNRISFGPAPGDIEAVRRVGLETYIEQQLHPQSFAEPPSLTARLRELPTLNMSISQLANATIGDLDGIKPKDLSPEQKKSINQREQAAMQELVQAKILRALISPAQLQEVMVDFWFNHFNVSSDKNGVRVMVGSYERDAIRPYALGKFRDLLGATAHHPAMLVYLDNALNVDPDSPLIRGKKIGINENYAREIMELHTLGVNGGYTQQDVTTLAHILTGWGIGNTKEDRGTFMFHPMLHDNRDQRFLGQTVQGGGQEEIEHALDILARHPATAQHIAYQLAQYFVADDPPPTLVRNLATTFTSSNGDIAAVLRVLFHAPEFWDAKSYNAKFKSPFRFIISTLRATDIVPSGKGHILQATFNQWGEPLYRCLTPNGYANTKDQWLNSDALLKRISFIKSLNQLLGEVSPQTVFSALGRTGWSKATMEAVNAGDANMQGTMLLSSPEFLYY